MPDNPDITCRNCRKQYPSSQMKYSRNGKDMICPSCVKLENERARQLGLLNLKI